MNIFTDILVCVRWFMNLDCLFKQFVCFGDTSIQIGMHFFGKFFIFT